MFSQPGGSRIFGKREHTPVAVLGPGGLVAFASFFILDLHREGGNAQYFGFAIVLSGMLFSPLFTPGGSQKKRKVSHSFEYLACIIT